MFFFSKPSKPSLGPTKTHIQWAAGAFPTQIKRPGRETCVKVKNDWRSKSNLSMSSGLLKGKHSILTFPFWTELTDYL